MQVATPDIVRLCQFRIVSNPCQGNRGYWSRGHFAGRIFARGREEPFLQHGSELWFHSVEHKPHLLERLKTRCSLKILVSREGELVVEIARARAKQ